MVGNEPWGGDPNYTLSGSDDPYDYGFTGTPGNMYVLPGEGVGEPADTGLTVPEDTSPTVDPITGKPVMPAGSTNWLDIVKGLFTGSTGGTFGQLAAFGGLAALLNKLAGSQSQQPVGYQGGIPQLTYTRQQTPMAQQRPAGYRPGQGGISYFTGGTFSPASAASPAATYTTPPATPTDETINKTVPTTPDRTVSVATGGYMPSGIAMLAAGGQGGRYLRGPGDGVSDSIPARFAGSGKPARLADGEFVIDARTVSEIGNGSSEAGARKLYAMMDRVHKARKTAKRGEPSKADKYLPK